MIILFSKGINVPRKERCQVLRELSGILSRIDGKGYKAYKDLQGKTFHFGEFDLIFHYVQGDPFASPSMVSVRMHRSGESGPPEGAKGEDKGQGNEKIQFGHENIRLYSVEQIVDNSQTRVIGDMIHYAVKRGSSIEMQLLRKLFKYWKR